MRAELENYREDKTEGRVKITHVIEEVVTGRDSKGELQKAQVPVFYVEKKGFDPTTGEETAPTLTGASLEEGIQE